MMSNQFSSDKKPWALYIIVWHVVWIYVDISKVCILVWNMYNGLYLWFKVTYQILTKRLTWEPERGCSFK